MNNYKINTTLFGQLDITIKDGLYEHYNIILSDQKMNVALNINEYLLDDENINIIKDFIEHIPQMYEKGKEELLKIRNTSELVKFFIEFHLDELTDNILDIFAVESVKHISSELFIKKLILRTISIGQDSTNKIDCTFDFSLPEGYTDELLVVRFNNQYNIYNISHES